jgi:hypothetical protein
VAKDFAPIPDLTPALDQLTAEGLVWRGRDSDRRAYNLLSRWREAAAAQMHARGWGLVHHESMQMFQALHRKGRHRRRLHRNTLLCLLALRLLRAETPPGLTPQPAVSLQALIARCLELGFQPDLAAALPELAALKLIRAPAGVLRPGLPSQLIELLPALEIAVSDSAVAQLADRLAAQPPPPVPAGAHSPR